MKFAVESWAPEYGAPAEGIGDDGLAAADARVDPWVEVGDGAWAPRQPGPGTVEPACTLFVDGVRRVEANIWINGGRGAARRGLCASYAAGAVRCDGTATLVDARVARALLVAASPAAGDHDHGDDDVTSIATRHGTFTFRPSASHDPDDLPLLLQRCMAELEAEVAAAAGPSIDLVVLDGPLRGGVGDQRAVGYVKTHRRTYGPTLVRDVVAVLAPGERTPLLLVDSHRARYTWYLRLPGEAAHAWSGVVRVEMAAVGPVVAAAARADAVSLALPRYASVPQKDPRAPQNLVPIGGLERELRRRLGDPALLYRSLRLASAAA